jgi:hypothetical protein
MVRYANGQIPPPGTPGSPLKTIAKGIDSNGYWEFQTTEATYARWKEAKRYAEWKFGRPIFIRTGWNVYRPLDVQRSARIRACNQGNCNAAAYPGYSSHGGNWQGRDCLAIDVDPNGLAWWQVHEACRHAGFAVGLITKAIAGIDEPWHVIDFNAFGAVPAFGDVKPFPLPLPEEEKKKPKEKDMILLKGIDSGSGTTAIMVVAGPGVWDRYSLAFEGALEEQFGPALELTKTSMLEKENLYKSAGITAAKIDAALADNFDAIVKAINSLGVVGGGGGTVDVQAIAKAVNDDHAQRMTG